MNKSIIRKALALFIVLAALLLPTAGWAQAYDDYYVFDNTAESAYDMNDIEMFDWAEFTDLFDQTAQNSVLDEWFSDFIGVLEFSNRDSGMEWSGGGMIPTNPETGEVPLGSGLVLLVAAGAGYAVLKRKEDKQ